MKIESVSINGFRNLVNFRIEFSEIKTVLIGQNASGKSNFLEAIVLIFKQLDFPKKNILKEYLFEYEIIYTIYNKKVKIIRRIIDGKAKFEYKLYTGKKNILNEEVFDNIVSFTKNRNEYLPRYIFAYYSGLGNSNRLEEHFKDHKADFARRAKKMTKELPSYPRMLYAELIHSQLSLFSFFIEDENLNSKENIKNFLLKNLEIEDIKSVLFTITEPDWATTQGKLKEPKFFDSEGVVKNLLYHLHDNVAFAPFRDRIKNSGGLYEKKFKKEIDVVYLFIDNFKKIRDFVKENKWTAFDLFHVLNTANVSKLISKEGIKIRVKKKFANKLLFRDLSEGEQQLLTVLGLMRFTKTDEALFLLDEPDTHLNPLWQWKYMDFIDEIVFKNSKDKLGVQVIMTSHAPLTIGGLKKEEVRILKQVDDKIITSLPDQDPKGMGVAGILTEIFDIPSTLDIATNDQLERRRHIESMIYNLEKNSIPLPNEENLRDIRTELETLNKELDNLGISRITRDPMFQEFQAHFDNAINYKKSLQRPLTIEEQIERDTLMEKIMKELIEKQGI